MGEWLALTTPAGPVRAWLSRPDTSPSALPLGAVVVVQEIFGVNPHIRGVADRFAQAGFTAMAPALFDPVIPGVESSYDDAGTALGRELAAELGFERALQVVSAAARWLRESGHRVGVVGFCWGGAFVNRLAVASGDKLSAGVVYYGTAPDSAEAPRVSAPLLIQLAGLDARVNNSAFPWVAALRAANKPVVFQLYDGVNHAFNNDTSAERFNPPAADLAWKRTLAFFRAHLR